MRTVFIDTLYWVARINPKDQEGAKVLVTLLPDDDTRFWLHASQTALDKIWDNKEDDVYAELLK